jgi:DNA-binding NarL/FixJ family response regulator
MYKNKRRLMRQITLDRVKKDNSNIRYYSDSLWRELRKCRFKKANPDPLTNQMAAEQYEAAHRVDTTFIVDMQAFADKFLSTRESKILGLWLFGGQMRQVDIAEALNISQALVSQELENIFDLLRKHYYKR